MSKLLIASLFLGIVMSFPIIYQNIDKDITTREIDNFHHIIYDNDDYLIKYDEQNNQLYCSICEYIVRKAEYYITNRTSEDEAIHYFENICSSLPKLKQNMCIILVKDNYQKLINMIHTMETPNIICSNVHVCTKNNENVSNCNFCKYASRRIENFMNQNNTLSDIINYGEHFCDYINEKLMVQCENIINMHYLELVTKLIDYHNFDDACEAIRLCPKSKS